MKKVLLLSLLVGNWLSAGQDNVTEEELAQIAALEEQDQIERERREQYELAQAIAESKRLATQQEEQNLS